MLVYLVRPYLTVRPKSYVVPPFGVVLGKKLAFLGLTVQKSSRKGEICVMMALLLPNLGRTQYRTGWYRSE